MIAFNLILTGAALGCAPGDPPLKPPSAKALLAAPTFDAGERLVATYYFYWYRYPDQHCAYLRYHDSEPSGVSYTSRSWHLRQLRDMVAAGIDVALPVYWGLPGAYDRKGIAFSVRGLPPLVAALDQMRARGERTPRIGLFYDTSTLRMQGGGSAPDPAASDLRTPAGRERFYRTIRDFFCQVPPRHWAQIDGRPLVVLYSAAFAAGFDQGAFDELARRFAGEFHGKRPFVIRERSWKGIDSDAEYIWGAALRGAQCGSGTVAIGPGYDDSQVPGRRTPIREREEGRFYEKSWLAALASGRNIALVETWNEHHEGSSINATAEFGRRYIELTARYAAAFKRREVLSDEIVLAFPDPRPRPDLSWGADARGELEVSFRAGQEPCGLRPVRLADGPFEQVGRAEEGVVLRTPDRAEGELTYLYFQVSDHFAFDGEGAFELRVRYRASPSGRVCVEFDSNDRAGPHGGAYMPTRALKGGERGGWCVDRLLLRRARFANRQNGAADLRLRIEGAVLELGELRLRRAAQPPNPRKTHPKKGRDLCAVALTMDLSARFPLNDRITWTAETN